MGFPKSHIGFRQTEKRSQRSQSAFREFKSLFLGNDLSLREVRQSWSWCQVIVLLCTKKTRLFTQTENDSLTTCVIVARGVAG